MNCTPSALACALDLRAGVGVCTLARAGVHAQRAGAQVPHSLGGTTTYASRAGVQALPAYGRAPMHTAGAAIEVSSRAHVVKPLHLLHILHKVSSGAGLRRAGIRAGVQAPAFHSHIKDERCK